MNVLYQSSSVISLGHVYMTRVSSSHLAWNLVCSIPEQQLLGQKFRPNNSDSESHSNMATKFCCHRSPARRLRAAPQTRWFFDTFLLSEILVRVHFQFTKWRAVAQVRRWINLTSKSKVVGRSQHRLWAVLCRWGSENASSVCQTHLTGITANSDGTQRKHFTDSERNNYEEFLQRDALLIRKCRYPSSGLAVCSRCTGDPPVRMRLLNGSRNTAMDV